MGKTISRLPSGPSRRPANDPAASTTPSPGSALEAARFIASVSLSLGALMLSLFGIIERMVSFEKLGVVNELALLALLPGIATLAFLACARAISWMISYMTFAQWHAVVPQHRWDQTRRLVEEGSQFRFRITLMAGAYLLFTLVITALAATSAGLASERWGRAPILRFRWVLRQTWSYNYRRKELLGAMRLRTVRVSCGWPV